MDRVFKWFAAAAAGCALLRLLLAGGLAETARGALRALGEDPAFASLLLGAAPAEEPETETGPVAAGDEPAGESAPPAPQVQANRLLLETVDAKQEKAPALPMPKTAEEAGPLMPEVRNNTACAVDAEKLLAEPLPFTLAPDAPQVLVLHTHGSEAYSQKGGAYVESDHSRTEDKSKNVVRVGTVLAESLAERGYTVLHDTELYDYPSYSGSYGRSLAAVESCREEYPSVQVVIDLHRDAAADTGGEPYRTEYVAPGGTIASQVMLIAATGQSGLSFPEWEKNMVFALRLQQKLQETYPGLARPLYVSPERYNEHAAPGYLLIEVGTDGNTLSEAENAARLLGECLAEVLDAAMEEP